jgi:putative ABC transport system ATP-binding protein
MACGWETSFVTLEAVGLRIGDGEFVVAPGPSGSGKTTLLNLIGARDTPASGRITVGSKDISAAKPRAALAFRRHTVGFILQVLQPVSRADCPRKVQFEIDVSARRDGDRAEAKIPVCTVEIA